MTITLRGVSNAAGEAAGSVGASTVSITPTLPSGAVSGDRIFVYQVGTIASGTTPTDWTVVLSKDSQLGSGTAASGTGLRKATWYYRDYDGVWTMPAFTLTSAANNSHWIGAIALTPTAGSIWDAPAMTFVGSSYNTATTSYTDSTLVAVALATDGFLMAGAGLNDNVTSTTSAFTQTGTTFSTVTERCDGGTSTGFTVSGKIHTATVTTAGFSGTLTETLTLSATSQGETIFVHQTEHLPGPAFSTLIDNFDTGATPDAKWTITGTVVQSNGDMVITGDGASELDSAAGYNLTGSSVFFQARAVSTDAFMIINGTSSSLGFHWTSSTQVDVYATSADVGIPRTHTPGDWYRVRESGGTIFWDFSPNGVDWTNMDTEVAADYSNLTTAMLSFFVITNTGVGSRFDNFNVAAARPRTYTRAPILRSSLY